MYLRLFFNEHNPAVRCNLKFLKERNLRISASIRARNYIKFVNLRLIKMVMTQELC